MAYILENATPGDMAAIQAIYAYYVLHTTSTFEEIPPTLSEMQERRLATSQAGLPYMVAKEANGAVLGYAYAAPYRSRTAYRFTVEDSIYIAKEGLGKGIGTALLSEVIKQVERLGFQQMVAIIGGTHNAASINLHTKLGFSEVGTLSKVGFKHNQWVDTRIMQRVLQEKAFEGLSNKTLAST